MPQNIELAAFVLGAVLLLLALTTGGFKIFGAEMRGTAGRWSRAVAGICGAILIGFAVWHSLQDQAVAPAAPHPAPPPTTAAAGSSPEAPPAPTLIAPHAPELNIAQGVAVWGQDTKLLSLGPGERVTLYGKDLFAEQPTFPTAGCLGPAYVAYTWQVREPYPKGGDLEITSIVQGGSRPLVGRGSVGAGQMSVCDEHTFKNNGLDPIKVEVRYGSYAEP
jgi:hypothetical protein